MNRSKKLFKCIAATALTCGIALSSIPGAAWGAEASTTEILEIGHAVVHTPAPAGETTPTKADISISADGFTFGVVSDTHVSATRITHQERIRKALAFYSNESGAEFLAVVSDLTDYGNESEMNAWKEIKEESLTISLIATMGNHEQYAGSGLRRGKLIQPCGHAGIRNPF